MYVYSRLTLEIGTSAFYTVFEQCQR